MLYRIYSLGDDGHFHSPPKEIKCDDDATATEQAKRLLDGHDLEVWEGTRRVTVLRHEG